MRQILLALVMGTMLLASCQDSASVRVDETRSKLVGTWLRETESGKVRSRHVVALAPDGKFTERLVVAIAGEPPQMQDYEGEWSFDGTNFKRRFLQENGRKFSGGKIRFTTFPLVSVGASEFVVSDNIQGAQVTFHRVSGGTRP